MAKKSDIVIPTELIEKKIIKEYGNVLTDWNSYEERPEYIVNTVLPLDIALNGGIRLGSTVLMSGKHSAGKTTLALYLAGRSQQQFDMPVYYFKIEGRLHKSLVNGISCINKDKFKIIESVKGSILFAEQQLQILIDFLKVVDRGFYIIDSLSMLCPEKEFENDMDEDVMMVNGRLAAKFFRKACHLVGPTDSVVVLISQERAKQAVGTFSKKSDASGGTTMRYQNDLHISCRKGNSFFDESKRVFGHELKAKIEKLSWGTGVGSEIDIPIKYGEGVFELKALFDIAVQLNLVQKSGSWFSYNGEKIGQGYVSVLDFFDQNDAVVVEISKKIREMFFDTK